MASDTRPVFRFAPSPNGYLHLGHAFSALFTWRLARATNGRFLLRIEDIDRARCKAEFETAIIEDLAWLGISWEEPVRRQSEHFADYARALARLESMGLIYPCFATRREIQEVARERPTGFDPDGAPLFESPHKHAPAGETAARLAAGAPHTLRLDMARALELAAKKRPLPLAYLAVEENGTLTRMAADPARWGDVVLARKDVPTSYHLSVVVDDALQGITHVTRGLDLLPSTDLHVLLQTLLDLPSPLYRHHPLVRDACGRKLSKSARDTSLRALRDQGIGALDIIGWFEARSGPFAGAC